MPVAQFTIWISEIRQDDNDLVGAHAANLGELAMAGFPILPGFALTSTAYDLFSERNNLTEKIDLLLTQLDDRNPETYQIVAKKITRLVTSFAVPEEIAKEVIASYKDLAKKTKFAVGIAGDIAAGEATLIDYIRQNWAKSFDTQLLLRQAGNHNLVQSLVVQAMAPAGISGTAYSIDQKNSDKGIVTVEILPDYYRVNKNDLKIIERQTSSEGKYRLSDQKIVEIAGLAKTLEKHYYFPQEVDFVIAGGQLYLLSTHPVTIMPNSKTRTVNANKPVGGQKVIIKLKTATKIYLLSEDVGLARDLNCDGIISPISFLARDFRRVGKTKHWLACATPAQVITLDKFIDRDVDGVLIDSEKLTQLTLNQENGDPLDPALLFTFYKIIKTCQKKKVTCSFLGHGIIDRAELLEKLVKWGITSITTTSELVTYLRQIVYETESRIVAGARL